MNILSALSYKNQLKENADEFISEVTFVNFFRLKIISLAALCSFLILLIYDIFLFYKGKWVESVGYEIITSLHVLLIFVLFTAQMVFVRKKLSSKDSVNLFHRVFNEVLLVIGLICIIFISLGDVLTNGSIAAYLGTIFMYASIFIMTTWFSLILYGASMILMVFLLVYVNNISGMSMDIQIINTISFSLMAFIFSRIHFRYFLNDYTNRQVIVKQKQKIKTQVTEKEKLIKELEGTLSEINTLSGLLPICSNCKKIRDDKGYWKQIESYLKEHSEAEFSHGLCPECLEKLYSKEEWYIDMKNKKMKSN